MTNEHLEAVLEGDSKTTRTKNYIVSITVQIPYPKEYEFREQASGVAPAVSRALKELRKQLKGKRIHEYRIKAVQF